MYFSSHLAIFSSSGLAGPKLAVDWNCSGTHSLLERVSCGRKTLFCRAPAPSGEAESTPESERSVSLTGARPNSGPRIPNVFSRVRTPHSARKGSAGGDGDANSAASSGGQATRPPGECYDLLGRYLRHGFGSSLPTDPSVQPLVLIEKSYAIPPVRQRCLEVLFEELDVPAAFLARDAVMACYAVGRSTGTVVDVGHGGTVVTPVYDGFVEARGILKSPAGGGAVDSHVLGVLDGLLRDQRSSRAPPAGGYDPSEPPYVLPLYQVRARRARASGRLTARWPRSSPASSPPSASRGCAPRALSRKHLQRSGGCWSSFLT